MSSNFFSSFSRKGADLREEDVMGHATGILYKPSGLVSGDGFFLPRGAFDENHRF